MSVSSVALASSKVFSAIEQPAAEYTTFFKRLKCFKRSYTFKGRQRVVLMIGERIMDGALIAVISREEWNT